MQGELHENLATWEVGRRDASHGVHSYHCPKKAHVICPSRNEHPGSHPVTTFWMPSFSPGVVAARMAVSTWAEEPSQLWKS